MNEELFAYESQMQLKRLDSAGQIVHHIAMNAVILTDGIPWARTMEKTVQVKWPNLGA